MRFDAKDSTKIWFLTKNQVPILDKYAKHQDTTTSWNMNIKLIAPLGDTVMAAIACKGGAICVLAQKLLHEQLQLSGDKNKNVMSISPFQIVGHLVHCKANVHYSTHHIVGGAVALDMPHQLERMKTCNLLSLFTY